MGIRCGIGAEDGQANPPAGMAFQPSHAFARLQKGLPHRFFPFGQRLLDELPALPPVGGKLLQPPKAQRALHRGGRPLGYPQDAGVFLAADFPFCLNGSMKVAL